MEPATTLSNSLSLYLQHAQIFAPSSSRKTPIPSVKKISVSSASAPIIPPPPLSLPSPHKFQLIKLTKETYPAKPTSLLLPLYIHPPPQSPASLTIDIYASYTRSYSMIDGISFVTSPKKR